MDIPIREAAEMWPGEIGEQRILKLLAEAIGDNRKIVAGPVEDVPTYMRDVWLIGYTDEGLYYLISSLRERKPNPKSLRQDLARRIKQLPEGPVDVQKILGDLFAHQALGKEVCAALFVGERRFDKVEITVLCFSVTFTPEEAGFLLRETVKMSRRKQVTDSVELRKEERRASLYTLETRLMYVRVWFREFVRYLVT